MEMMNSSGNNLILKQISVNSEHSKDWWLSWVICLVWFILPEISTHIFEDKIVPPGTSGTMHQKNEFLSGK